MEYLIAIAVVAGLLVTAAGFARRMRSTQWDSLAESLGLEHDGQLLFGELDGVDVQALVRIESDGLTMARMVYVAARLKTELDVGLRVRTLKETERSPSEHVRFRESAIDANFAVTGDERDRVSLLIAKPLRGILADDVASWTQVLATDRGIALFRSGSENNPAWIRRSLRACVKWANAIEDARSEVPPALALADVAEGTSQLALELGFEAHATPLGMSGMHDGRSVFAYTSRVGHEVYAMRVGVLFLEPLDAGLSVHAPDDAGIEGLFYGADEQRLMIGDDELIAYAYDEDNVGELLDEALQAAVMRMHKRYRKLRIDDRSLSVEIEGIPSAAEPILEVVAELSVLAERIGVHVRSSGYSRRGPYR